jgi:hypothetical protein
LNNLIVEIKIYPKILSFNQEGKKIMFKKDKVDHEIPNALGLRESSSRLGVV